MSKQIYLFIILALFTLPTIVNAKTFTTPYYSINLDNSAQQIKKDVPEHQTFKGTESFYFVYAMANDDSKAQLTVIITKYPPSPDKIDPDRMQRQFIAGVVHGFTTSSGNPSDPYTVYKQVKTTKLGNKEFRKFIYNYSDNLSITVYTLFYQHKIYAFILSSTANSKDTMEKISQMIAEQIGQIKLI